MKIIELPFTILELHGNYVVGRTKEGINLSIENHLEVLEILNKHLTSPYGFIVDEVNSYSIDLDVMLHIRKDKNIGCIGVVYYRIATKLALELGQDLTEKPVHFSSSINDVADWVREQVA